MSTNQQAAHMKKRAWSLFDLANYDEALAVMDEVIGLEPESSVHVLEKGVMQFRMHTYEDAVQTFDAVLAHNPQNVSAINNAAKSLMLLGRFEESLARYTQSLSINPAPAKTWVDAALVLARLEQWPEAFEHLDQALEREPNNPDVWYQCGWVAWKAGDADAALQNITNALSLSNETHYESLRDRGFILREKGQPQEAITSLQQALRIKPNSIDTELEIAEALVDLRQLDKAARVFEALVRKDKDCAAAWDGKGRVLVAQGALDRGALNRGTACMIRGDHEAALVLLDEAIQHKANYPEAWSNKGVVLNRLGRFEEAVECYKKAIQYDPGAIVVMHNLGMILYYELDRKPEALRYFKETVRKDRQRWAKLPSEIRVAVDSLP